MFIFTTYLSIFADISWMHGSRDKCERVLPPSITSVFGKRRFLDLWHILHQICQWTLKDDLETRWDSSNSWEDTSGHQILANLYTVDILWRYLDLHYGEVPLVLWSKYVVFLRNAAKRACWLSTLWPSCFEESVERNKRDPLGRDRGRIFWYHSRLTYLSGLVFLLGSLPSDHSYPQL